MLNAISIDVEEYFQVSAFESLITREEWEMWPSRVETQIGNLLEVFAESGVNATFFTLGYIAERFPDMIRDIVGAGHELACHGYQHVRITQQSPAQFREDLHRSKSILEDVAGVSIRGYRAASFSINRTNLWAFEEIEHAGFRYSSSVYPVKHDLYGIPDAPRGPYHPNGPSGLLEIPVTTAKLLNRNIPAGGGGYFRLFPYPLSRLLLQQVIRREGMTANMYFHPWEFDPDQPRPAKLSARTRFRHYLNQDRALVRLRSLLRDFTWGTFERAYEKQLFPSGTEITGPALVN